MNDYLKNEPKILTQNSYFWKPAGNAQRRRDNEQKKHQEVDDFLKSLPDPYEYGLEVWFEYSESCTSVYKRFTVNRTADGSKTNIKIFRKLYTPEGRKQLKKEHEKRIAKKVAHKLLTSI